MTAIIFMAYTMPIACFLSFYIGFKVAKQVIFKDETEVKKQNVTFVKRGQETQETETPEQKKQRIFTQNIENYGTPKPQQEV